MEAPPFTFEQSPTLRALLVYFDPAPRPAILASLAALGVFVAECTAREAETIEPDPQPDLVIACGLRYDRDQLAVVLFDRLDSVLVVAAERKEDVDLFRADGLMAALVDPLTGSLPFQVVAEAAARARGRRLPARTGGV